MGIGSAVCSNLALSGEPPASQNHFNHCAKGNEKHIHTHTYIQRERERERERDAHRQREKEREDEGEGEWADELNRRTDGPQFITPFSVADVANTRIDLLLCA